MNMSKRLRIPIAATNSVYLGHQFVINSKPKLSSCSETELEVEYYEFQTNFKFGRLEYQIILF